jgi:exopolyphosphatase/guanosine-5'-triphosphate,3'-diphosphate pyrophosphatase
MTIEERQTLAGMEPKRADVIVAGALILLLSAREFGATELEVSTRGLRYGVAKALSEGSLK